MIRSSDRSTVIVEPHTIVEGRDDYLYRPKGAGDQRNLPVAYIATKGRWRVKR